MNPFLVIWNEIDTFLFLRKITIYTDTRSWHIGYYNGDLFQWAHIGPLVIRWPRRTR